MELDPAMVTPQFEDVKEIYDNPFGESVESVQEEIGGWCLDDYLTANENTFLSNNSGGFISGEAKPGASYSARRE